MNDRAGPVLLYDGLCGFCDRTVRWILRADRRGAFRFAPLQGDFAGSVLGGHPELRDIDSLVLIEQPTAGALASVYVRSEALLRIVGQLGGAWRLLGVFRLIPGPLRDWAYDAFARRRYRVFGRFDVCPVPPSDVRGRFLD